MKNILVKDFEINQKEFKNLEENYHKDDKNIVIKHALSKNPISEIVYDAKNEIDVINDFSIDIKTLPVCNQKNSGRCWIFAACNFLREKIAHELNVTNFELSQNYIAFFDKLEKSNYLLSSIADLIESKPNERVLMHLLYNGVGDGGQWDMFVNLIKKYGVVPKNAMKESYQSSATMESDALINSLCRQFAVKAQKLFKEGKKEEILTLKKDTIQLIYNLLVNSFGLPPKKFDFEYKDKDGKFHSLNDMSPLSFYEKFVKNIDDYVSIVNAPTKTKEFYKTYTIAYLNNVIEGKDIVHLNLPMNRVKELIINQLKDGEIVWFGSDVSKYRERTLGLWDDLSYDYLSAFGFDLKFDKGDMLDYHESAMNHAMCLTGVNIKNGLPNRWKVENSWGKDVGNEGYFIMSDSWFDRYVYQAVVNKKYLNDKELAAFKSDPIVLDPWDPLGTLAE